MSLLTRSERESCLQLRTSLHVGARLKIGKCNMWFGNSINQRRTQRCVLLHATLVQIRPKKTQPALTALSANESPKWGTQAMVVDRKTKALITPPPR